MAAAAAAAAEDLFDFDDNEAGGDPLPTLTSPTPYRRSGARGIKSVGDNDPRILNIDWARWDGDNVFTGDVTLIGDEIVKPLQLLFKLLLFLNTKFDNEDVF